jgi:hypothetical protein
VAGVRGTIRDPVGKKYVNYAWGLGNVLNNLTKTYALWCGINLEKEEGIKKIVVIGDLLLVIQALNDQGCPSGNKIMSLLKSIKHLA